MKHDGTYQNSPVALLLLAEKLPTAGSVTHVFMFSSLLYSRKQDNLYIMAAKHTDQARCFCPGQSLVMCNLRLQFLHLQRGNA